MEEKLDYIFTQIDEDFNELSPKAKELSLKIFDFFKKKIDEKNLAIDTLQNPSISLLHLKDTIGCSRTTIYTNNALKKLYEYFTAELENDNPYTYIKKQKDDIDEMQMQLNNCYDRDIDFEKQRIEINNLNRLLQEKYKEIETLRLRIAKLSSKK